jgi:HEAT repeat protein
MNRLSETLLFILLAEAVYLFFLIIAILARRLIVPFLRKKSVATHSRISRSIAGLMEDESLPSTAKIVPSDFSDFPNLLTVMESFNWRFRGSRWQEIKQAVGAAYLLPPARKLSRSTFWRKRNMAARAFLLISEKEDEPTLLSLMDDSSFLVRSFASSAAIQAESKKGILKTLERMIAESGYARCYYTDVLLQGSTQVFSEIVRIATETPDPQMQLVCSEVLSKKTVPFPLPFLRAWLEEKNSQIRLQALKILLRNPQGNSGAFVIKSLDDPDEKIRTAAICCLEYFFSDAIVDRLEKFLSDSSWRIRLEAAKLLKKMGKTEILNRQKEPDDTKAYEVAQYVLQF